MFVTYKSKRLGKAPILFGASLTQLFGLLDPNQAIFGAPNEPKRRKKWRLRRRKKYIVALHLYVLLHFNFDAFNTEI